MASLDTVTKSRRPSQTLFQNSIRVESATWHVGRVSLSLPLPKKMQMIKRQSKSFRYSMPRMSSHWSLKMHGGTRTGNETNLVVVAKRRLGGALSMHVVRAQTKKECNIKYLVIVRSFSLYVFVDMPVLCRYTVISCSSARYHFINSFNKVHEWESSKDQEW